MEQIKDIIHDVIEKLSGQDNNRELGRVWQNAVGKKMARHTQISGLKHGKLLVRVDSPVAMFQLNLKRNQILKELQKVNKDLLSIELVSGRV
jgi:predicted nucleic acid-binding Zn ribbon protein